MAKPDTDDKSGKITLDIELKDLLDVASRSTHSSILDDSTALRSIEGEDLKKAWFRHMLSSMEKLSDLVEIVRRVDIAELRTDMRSEIKRLEIKIDRESDSVKVIRQELRNEVVRNSQDLKDNLKDIIKTAEKAKEELSAYKKEVVEPLKSKVLTISIKLGIWATLAGFVGSGIGAIVLYVAKEYLAKTALTGSP